MIRQALYAKNLKKKKKIQNPFFHKNQSQKKKSHQNLRKKERTSRGGTGDNEGEH